MTGKRRLARGWGALCILVLWTPTFAGKPTTEYSELLNAAAIEANVGHLDKAYQLLMKLYELAPDIETTSYSAASCAARLGKLDESFEWLGNAADRGFAWPAAVRADQNLASLHGDPRWGPLVDRIQANSAAEVREMQARRPDSQAYPTSTPAFKSYRKLAAHFDRRRDTLETERWHMSRKAAGESALRLQDERAAAVWRYLAEHPTAKDREAAAWDAVTHRAIFQYPFALKYVWGDAGVQGIEDLDAFVKQYTASPHRAEALTLRAFAVFHTREESGSVARPWSADDLRNLDAALADVATRFRGSTGGGTALVRRLIVAELAAAEGITPDMRAMRTEIETTYKRDPDVQKLVAAEGRGVIARMDGLDGFDGTDLDGRRWDKADFAGQVTIIDFWATWCQPCVAELPTLRKIWAEFQPGGLQILGVSLDSDSLKSFKDWLRANDVSWPQISDGRGFGTPLAQKFRVRMIPFTLLIGPDGRIAGANLRGDDLETRVRDLIEQKD